MSPFKNFVKAEKFSGSENVIGNSVEGHIKKSERGGNCVNV